MPFRTSLALELAVGATALAGIALAGVAAIPASMLQTREAPPAIVPDSGPTASVAVDNARSMSTEPSEEADPYAAYYYCARDPQAPKAPKPME